jgi:hypothetical protein
MNPKHYYLYQGLMLALAACGGVSRPDIIKQSWQVNKIEIIAPNEKSAPSPQTGDSKKINYQIVYNFKENGNYFLKNGSRLDSGQWALSSDERVLVLKSATNPLDNSEFLIEELNSYRLVLATENKGKKEVIELSPLR